MNGGISFAQRIGKEKSFVYDIRFHGKCFILQVNPSLHESFRVALKGKDKFDILDYGEVLYSGYGEPSDRIKDEMVKKFGLYENEAIA